MVLRLDDILDLVKFGKTVENVDKKMLQSFQQRDYINREGRDTWEKLVSGLSDNDLISVFKALVTIERELN